MGNAFRAVTARERSLKGVPRALRAIKDREAPSVPRPVGAVSRQCFNGVPDVPAAHQRMRNSFRAATARERSFKSAPRVLRATKDRETPSVPRPEGAVSRQCFNGVPDVPAAHQTMGNAFRAATARERSFKGVPRALRAIEDREAPSEPRPSESSPPWYFNGSVCTSSILPTQLTTPCGRGSVWLTRGAEEHGRT